MERHAFPDTRAFYRDDIEILSTVPYVVLSLLTFLASTIEGTVTITNPSRGNAVLIQGTLTLMCRVSPLAGPVFWHIPGGATVCYCDNTVDNCTPVPEAGMRYSCSSVIASEEFTITVTDVKITDEGSYRCRQASNNQESLINIAVQVPITSVDVTSPTSPVTVTENVPIPFVCETSPSRPQSTIRWYKKSGSDPAVPLPEGDISTPGSGASTFTRSTLQYIPVRGDHDYRLYCTAYNIDTTPLFTSTNKPQMYVQYAPANPTITNHAGTNFKIIDGRSQSLTCTVQGGRPLATLNWSCFSGTEQDTSTGETVSKQVTWTAAQVHDGQRCTCRATQLIWTSDREVFVVIDALSPPSTPTFTIQGQSVSGTVNVIEGSDVSVRCSSSGNPPPGYTWTTLGSSTSGDILTITNVQTSHQRSYTCEATNRMVPSHGDAESGTSSAAVSLNVLFPPRSPALTYGSISGDAVPATFSVVRGDNFNIYCQAVAKPVPSSYQWTGQSGSNNRLTVTGIQTDRSWTCKVTNQITPTVGNIVFGSNTAVTTASVMYGPSTPTLIYHYSASGSTPLTTGTLSVIQEKTFRVECDGSVSKPPPGYSWSGDLTSPSGTLTVDNSPAARDGATSTCTARNTMTRTFGAEETGASTKDLTIRVLYAPSVNSLSDETAVENDRDFAKTCSHTPGNPDTTMFEWTKVGSPTFLSREQTLTISRISKASAGEYRCTAKNTMNPTGESPEIGTHSQTFQLVVYYSASITAFSINGQSGAGPFTFDENSTITVRCEVDSNPGYQITLARDDIVLQAVENPNVATHEITKITCSEAGAYSCAAKNDYNVNNIPDASSRQVFVRCPPRPVNMENNQTYPHALGDNVTLSIEFTAYPAPTSYRWYKQRQDDEWTEIRAGKYSAAHQVNLTIQNIQQEEFGQYRVDIVNSQGTLEHLFFVSAQGVPDTPGSFSIIGSLTIPTFFWTDGFNGGYKQTFIIEVSPVGNDDWTEKRVVAEEDRSHVLPSGLYIADLVGLQPGSYMARLLSSNVLGRSKVSQLNSSFTVHASGSACAISPEQQTSVGAIAGGVVAGIEAIIIIIVVVVVILLLRRMKQIKKDAVKQTSDTKTEKVQMKETTANTHQYYNIGENTAHTARTDEEKPNVYETLDPELRSTGVYDTPEPRTERRQADTNPEYINMELSS